MTRAPDAGMRTSTSQPRARRWSGRLLSTLLLIPLVPAVSACDGSLAEPADGQSPWPAFAAGGAALNGTWELEAVNGRSLPARIATYDSQNYVDLNAAELSVCGEDWALTNWFTMVLSGSSTSDREDSYGAVEAGGGGYSFVRSDTYETVKTGQLDGDELLTTAPNGDTERWTRTSEDATC